MPASALTGQQPPEVGAGDLPVHTKKFRKELANEIKKVANEVIERLWDLSLRRKFLTSILWIKTKKELSILRHQDFGAHKCS